MLTTCTCSQGAPAVQQPSPAAQTAQPFPPAVGCAPGQPPPPQQQQQQPPPSQQQQQRGRTNSICYDFVKGLCQRGSECRYSHDLSLIARTARNGNAQRSTEVCYDFLR